MLYRTLFFVLERAFTHKLPAGEYRAAGILLPIDSEAEWVTTLKTSQPKFFVDVTPKPEAKGQTCTCFKADG